MTTSDFKPIRVMLVDDHTMVRKGIAAFLNVFPDLQMAGEAWDNYEAARDAIAENGMTFVNKKHGDIKPRPEVAIMQNSRLAFLRCMRELNLDVQPPENPRPNPLKYSR